MTNDFLKKILRGAKLVIVDIFKLRVQQVNEEYRKICDTLKRLEIEEYDLALALTSKQREIALLEQKLSAMEQQVLQQLERIS